MNLIKCGRNVTRTPHYHPSVTDVRSCYNGGTPPTFTAEGLPVGTPTPTPNGSSGSYGARNRALTRPDYREARTSPSPLPEPRSAPSAPSAPLTPNQARYYADLTAAVGEKNLLAENPLAFTGGPGGTISAEIDRLKHKRAALPKQQIFPDRPYTPSPTNTDLPEGIYVLDGIYYKVQRAVHGSGYLYAKEFNTFTQKFERSPGAIRHITPHHKVTAEAAAKFGAIYGVCVFCSRTLTDERSIAVGYGETCAGHHGLPWG